MKYSAIILLLFGLASLTTFADDTQLATKNLWIREAPPGASMMAGYGKLTNAGKQPFVLTGASSDAFKRVEIHRTTIIEDIVRMTRQDSIVIPPGESLVLEPNSYHWMLMGPKNTLKAGDTANLTLHFKSGQAQEITLEVHSAMGEKH